MSRVGIIGWTLWGLGGIVFARGVQLNADDAAALIFSGLFLGTTGVVAAGIYTPGPE